MLEKLKTHLEFGNYYCSVEHTNTGNNDETIFITLLKKHKKEVDIEQYFQSHSIDEVTSQLPKKQHIFLVLNTNQVLTKQIESSEIETIKLVYKAFPNINIEDFYFEVFNQGSSHFISICRKDYVDTIIEAYMLRDISIVNLSLGNLLVSNIIEYINGDVISTSNSNLTINSGLINRTEKRDEIAPINYNVNGLKTTDSGLLSLSGALQSVLKNNNENTNFESSKKQWLDKHRQLRFFNLFFKFGLVCILVMLLINFFVFNHYFNSVNELKQVSEINQSTKNRIVKLNESVSKKQKMVDDLLKSNTSKSSFYIDTIIQSMPGTILLSELNYQPLKKRIKVDKPIELNTNTINISGHSDNSEVFSNWISMMENYKWVDNINILDYGSTSNKYSDYSIQIIIKNDN